MEGGVLDLLPLELAVLAKLLEGDDPRLRALQRQLQGIRAESREFTGAGFYTGLVVPPSAPPAPMDALKGTLSDVDAEIDGLQHGAGFLLYIKAARLDLLEGYTYDEPWPEVVGGFRLTHTGGETRNLRGLEGRDS
jgi:hypothetical protein